ncbi:hypothetical protein V6N12_059687 [Hibiscus sabdariffa]|uniref:Uncharacterized protein n=1 Tax=Hibiscus sabdariffa TaxID=183260 RepID=A0ABR2EVT8_9ROSI
MGYYGTDYTLYRGNRSVRLDRCFDNAYWFERFPQSTLQHLLCMKSDLRPILLVMDDATRATSKPPFKYLSAWTLHKDFKRLVQENWDNTKPLAETIKTFSDAAVDWNRDVYGIVGKNKKQSSWLDCVESKVALISAEPVT